MRCGAESQYMSGRHRRHFAVVHDATVFIGEPRIGTMY
jgi:hypothetical protein